MFKLFLLIITFVFSLSYSISNAGLLDDVMKEVDKELGGALEKLNDNVDKKDDISPPKETNTVPSINDEKQENDKEFTTKINDLVHVCKSNEDETYTCIDKGDSKSNFVGVMKNKVPIKGIYKWKDGNTYEGDFNSQGQVHGKGIFSFKEGDVFEGDFKNQKQIGQGKLTYRDGNIQIGTFENFQMTKGETIESAESKKARGLADVNKELESVYYHYLMITTTCIDTEVFKDSEIKEVKADASKTLTAILTGGKVKKENWDSLKDAAYDKASNDKDYQTVKFMMDGRKLDSAQKAKTRGNCNSMWSDASYLWNLYIKKYEGEKKKKRDL